MYIGSKCWSSVTLSNDLYIHLLLFYFLTTNQSLMQQMWLPEK